MKKKHSSDVITSDDFTRHTCWTCKRKKQARFMRVTIFKHRGRFMWECINHNDEHRRYGKIWD